MTLSVTAGLNDDSRSLSWLDVSVCISALTGRLRPLIPITRIASKLPKWALASRKPRPESCRAWNVSTPWNATVICSVRSARKNSRSMMTVLKVKKWR